MQITIRFNGPIKRPSKEHVNMMEIDAGTRVSDLLDQLGYTSDHQRMIAVSINQSKARSDDVLPEAAVVDLVLLVGGG